ncbi:type II secretion system protein [Clostridium sp. JN-9]|uniref:type II secretion system protein n=1 Tax=Clostridium sp. JN-9 TaxID=2507159 RepID=UPI000FFE1BF6|nr:type II secretion system protein [Clostridium sp. JN-9]QAT40038.1 type II secretion system protein [Clostridium sp. JN-9]
MKNKKKKGFTLIEIMVAVAIMLVLMGFLVPKLAGYRAKAMEVKAINTGKQIYSAAMTSYSMTNGEFKEDDVKKVITDTTGIEKTEASSVDTKNDITILYSSDSNKYSVIIDVSGNTYIVKDGTGKELFTNALATAEEKQ